MHYMGTHIVFQILNKKAQKEKKNVPSHLRYYMR